MNIYMIFGYIFVLNVIPLIADIIDITKYVDIDPKLITIKKHNNQTIDFNDIKTERSIKLNDEGKKAVLRFLASDLYYMLCVSIDQATDNSGSILSIFHNKFIRILELKISHKKQRQRIKLLYSPDWAKSGYAVEKFKLSGVNEDRPVVATWQKFCLQYNHSARSITLRSKQQQTTQTNKLIYHLPSNKFNVTDISVIDIWLGQTNDLSGNYFKGRLANLVLSNDSNFYNTYLYDHPAENYLEKTSASLMMFQELSQLQKNMDIMKEQITLLSSSVESMKKCKCFPRCFASNGTEVQLDEIWMESDNCARCKCTMQGRQCNITRCPNISCSSPIKDPDTCCPRCPRQCKMKGKLFEHNISFTEKCLVCRCDDGSITCHLMDPRIDCPQLTCHKFLQYRPPGQCCSQCRVMDMCMLIKCAVNSECRMVDLKPRCFCNQGYQQLEPAGQCTDINECHARPPGPCPSNTRCINVPGSYSCVCADNHILDRSTNSCRPLCPQCNATRSTCLSPGVCHCLPGWTGPDCNQDIDECSLDNSNLIRCPINSNCVNYPGHFFCQCKPGYFLTKDKICQDIDECDVREGNICPDNQACINQYGGYSCIPIASAVDKSKQDCPVKSCDSSQSVIKHADRLTNHSLCINCSCDDGVLTCSALPCGCHDYRGNNYSGCSCASCKQFQQCQYSTLCQSGICPKPLNQTLTVIGPGQCCPIAANSNAIGCWQNLTNNNQSSLLTNGNGSMCVSVSRIYSHGAQIDIERCIECLCWNGVFCCRHKQSQCQL